VATRTASGIDWHAWLRRWDAQQAGYLPDREFRFTAMLDVLDILLPPELVALDLACGPGAISQRLLARFPRARSVAVDLDPVLLALGQGALGTMDGRLRWVGIAASLPGDDDRSRPPPGCPRTDPAPGAAASIRQFRSPHPLPFLVSALPCIVLP
jgi:SAM-dependent methyltransferase